MKRWFVGAVLIILVVAFGFLTQGVHKSSLTEDQETQMAQEAQKAQEAKEKEAAAKPAGAPASDAASTPIDTLPAEEVIGDPATAKYHIQVGWIYNNTDVVNSDKLKAALAEVRTFAQKSGGTTSAVLVDLDVPIEDRSPAAQGVVDLGVDVDDSSIYAQNPSEAVPSTLMAVLQGAIKPYRSNPTDQTLAIKS